MGDNAEVDLGFLRPAGPPPQGGGEASLESRNCALGLDSLTVFDFWKESIHATSVLTLGPTPMPTTVDLDNATTNAQHLASQDMVVFGVVGRVGQESVDADAFAGSSQHRTQQTSIVAWPIAYDGVDQKVRRVVTSQRQLGPARKKIAFLPYFVGIMRRAMSGFQSGRVDTGFLFRTDESSLFGVVEDCVQQSVEQTFFKRRCCAL